MLREQQLVIETTLRSDKQKENMSIFARLLHWLTHDLIVNKLANNKKFQELAVRIDSKLNKQNLEMTEKMLRENLVNVKGKVTEQISKKGIDFKSFSEIFKKELEKGFKDVKSNSSSNSSKR